MCVCVYLYVCVDLGRLCGLMAPSVHGFMNIVLWTESPRSSAQMEGERERKSTNLTQQR